MTTPRMSIASTADGAALLDDARIVNWTIPPDRMVVLVGETFLEITETFKLNTHCSYLVIEEIKPEDVEPRDPDAPYDGRYDNPDLSAPAELAYLATARSIWSDTAEATLDRAKAVLQANHRLCVVYPSLVWDKVLPQVANIGLHSSVAPLGPIRVDADNTGVFVHVKMAGDSKRFGFMDTALAQATPLMSRIRRDKRWLSYQEYSASPIESMFEVPDKGSTMHARMEHPERMIAYARELQEEILPLLAD